MDVVPTDTGERVHEALDRITRSQCLQIIDQLQDE